MCFSNLADGVDNCKVGVIPIPACFVNHKRPALQGGFTWYGDARKRTLAYDTIRTENIELPRPELWWGRNGYQLQPDRLG